LLSKDNNPKLKWKILNSLIIKAENSYNIPDINLNGSIIIDDKDKANNFNIEYTSGVYKLLLDEYPTYDLKVHEIEKLYNDALSSDTYHISPKTDKNEFHFYQTNSQEIYSQVLKLQNKSNNCSDLLCNSFITVINQQFSIIFSYIINLIYTNSIIPKQLKIASIIPKHKNGSRNKIINYRPIANINILAKILERNMLNRIIPYILSNKLLHPNQYAYQKNVGLLIV